MDRHSYLDEYEKLLIRMTTPRVMIDNAGCSNESRIMIDSVRKHGILLEAVQVLADMNLSIKKAYISSDGRWFMDVFHVTDLNGNKVVDKSVINHIEQALCKIHFLPTKCIDGLTALELTGTDRVGLLSEVFAVLADMQCNVVEAMAWTHNGRIALIIYVKDCESGFPIEDLQKTERIEVRLRNVLKGDDDDIRSAKTSVSMLGTHTERRLHQLMVAEQNYEMEGVIKTGGDTPIVSIQNCLEKGYSVVNIRCKDRTKLLFDVVCTLTDMQYIVFHAIVNTVDDNRSYLEFFIKHTDGTPIASDAEKQRVVICLQAAIERRTSDGVRLELCTADRPWLLADVTRTFRENGLNVVRAEISTTLGTALNIFYVTDALGNLPHSKIIEAVQQRIGMGELKVKEMPQLYQERTEKDESSMSSGGAMLFSIGSLVRKNLYNLGLIKSFS